MVDDSHLFCVHRRAVAKLGDKLLSKDGQTQQNDNKFNNKAIIFGSHQFLINGKTTLPFVGFAFFKTRLYNHRNRWWSASFLLFLLRAQ